MRARKAQQFNKFEAVATRFMKRWERDPRVIGILIAGSYARKTMDANSDIDFYIILGEGTWRERGNTWIDGIEVEYFINPIRQVHQYLDQERRDRSHSTAHLIANSEVLVSRDQRVTQLIRKARGHLRKPFKRPGRFQIETILYGIDDFKKDLEDLLVRKDRFAFWRTVDKLKELCLSAIMVHYGTSPVRPKQLRDQVWLLDRGFCKHYEKLLNARGLTSAYKASIGLASYAERLLGGPRPKEWRLRSKCG